MRNILIIIFSLIQLNSFSQPFWSVVVDNPYYNKSYLNNDILVGDTLIVLGGYISISSCESQLISAYNMNGKLCWEKYYGSNVIYTDLNFIYSIGYNIGEDDVAGDEFLNITKLDKNGNEVFNTKYPKSIPHGSYFNFIPNSVFFDKEKNIIWIKLKLLLLVEVRVDMLPLSSQLILE